MIDQLKQQIEMNLHAQALEAIKQYQIQNPALAELCYLEGICCRKLNNAQAAKLAFEKCYQLDERHVDACFQLANVLKNLGQYDEAIAYYLKLIALDAAHAKAWFNLGVSYQLSQKTDLAVKAYRQAIEIKPDYPEVLNNLGNLYRSMQDYEQACKCYEQALRYKPMPETAYNYGLAFQALKDFSAALRVFELATRLKPDYLNAILAMAVLLDKIGNYKQALVFYQKALAIDPENADVHFSAGLVFVKLKQLKPAIASYAAAWGMKPDYTEALGSLIQYKMHACDWQGLEGLFEALRVEIEQGKQVVPFNLLATPLHANIQKKCAEQYTSKNYPALKPLSVCQTHNEKTKIRLAYFSADFHNHATAYLMADLFSLHNREQFEVIGFSFGPVQDDDMALNLQQRFDQFHQVSDLSDLAIAQLAKKLQIDIAIDLKGYTRGARPAIFSHRPAPVQVSYLGYPGTLGASYFDYIIADPIVIPPGEEAFYTEKVAFMPDTYQVNASRMVENPSPEDRVLHGLPEQAFVFCSFNNNFKITPDIFACWMRLLEKVPNSVLWLFEANPEATKNLTTSAISHGIDPGRLVFAKKVSQQKHLNRYHSADLVLDTLYYNAHTTTSDALWVGCPVVTCIGTTFPARVAASILTAMGLSELITESISDYEKLALSLATQPQRLAALRDKISQNKSSTALFNTRAYAGYLEQLYMNMHKRQQAGLSPEHIRLE